MNYRCIFIYYDRVHTESILFFLLLGPLSVAICRVILFLDRAVYKQIRRNMLFETNLIETFLITSY